MSHQKYPQTALSADGSAKKRSTIKANGYSSDLLRAKRNARVAESEERQSAYSAMSVQDRIDQAKSRRGNSKRELKRLNALLAAQSKAAKK